MYSWVGKNNGDVFIPYSKTGWISRTVNGFLQLGKKKLTESDGDKVAVNCLSSAWRPVLIKLTDRSSNRESLSNEILPKNLKCCFHKFPKKYFRSRTSNNYIKKRPNLKITIFTCSN